MSYIDREFETAASHTPGPWEPTDMIDVPGQVGVTLPMPDNWIGVICSDENHGDVVAYCHPDNAPVIAAAPDLLAALKALQAWAEHTGGWEAPCWAQADAAVAKAISEARPLASRGSERAPASEEATGQ